MSFNSDRSRKLLISCLIYSLACIYYLSLKLIQLEIIMKIGNYTCGDLELFFGQYHEDFLSILDYFDSHNIVRRIWDKEPTVWKNDEDSRRNILNSLGWLNVVEEMKDRADDLKAFAKEIKSRGFTKILHMGMGGSSLAPEVIAKRFAPVLNDSGYPELMILDSTNPEAIKNIEDSVDLRKTIFIVASKSGSTTETDCFYSYFFSKLENEVGGEAGSQFIAITDPDSKLEEIARERRFRRCFLNFRDIGGRYSALSYFGMVPAALAGINVKTFLENAKETADRNKPEVSTNQNPGAILGLFMGILATRGRDKVTFISPPEMEPLGDWLEQLIAESIGKEGKSIVPIANEKSGSPEVYGTDRQFVWFSNDGDKDAETLVEKLIDNGHPVVKIHVGDAYSLASEFYRWEMATAVAGAVMGINPFDQPNVQESKDITKEVLEDYSTSGSLSREPVSFEANGIEVIAQTNAMELTTALREFLFSRREGDYLALMAFINPSAENTGLLQEVRHHIRDEYRIATTLGFGPRFLHSTGQMHKGGADNGLFIQITGDEPVDLEIPGKGFGFKTLINAQAAGDYRALVRHNRRILKFHLKGDVSAKIKELLDVVKGL
ncbi:MAG: glucose-6-phosphate isomerase [candidate division Zixibacteria bacterium]|nr:glucose-6-phosphate isomerase [candidate division Zixibacteria bacterium]